MKNVISYVNVILETGIAERASDVHIKHNNEESEIKFRIDGILTEISGLYEKIDRRILAKNMIEIISRIKILSEISKNQVLHMTKQFLLFFVFCLLLLLQFLFPDN